MMTLVTVAPILFLLSVAAGAALMSRAQRGLTLEDRRTLHFGRHDNTGLRR